LWLRYICGDIKGIKSYKIVTVGILVLYSCIDKTASSIYPSKRLEIRIISGFRFDKGTVHNSVSIG